jgi:Transposase DDE domain
MISRDPLSSAAIAAPPWVPGLPTTGPFEIFDLLSWKSRLSSSLIGREQHKQDLLDWAAGGRDLRIRLLTGPGGAGKTRLAAEVADVPDQTRLLHPAGLPLRRRARPLHLPGGRKTHQGQTPGGSHRRLGLPPRRLSACFTCPLKSQCTPTERRLIKRWENEEVLDRMQARLDRMPEAMAVRRQTVEHPFGTLKAWMGATHFLTRTLDKVRTEMSLHVLAYNLKRMITIFGVGTLIAAIRT